MYFVKYAIAVFQLDETAAVSEYLLYLFQVSD